MLSTIAANLGFVALSGNVTVIGATEAFLYPAGAVVAWAAAWAQHAATARLPPKLTACVGVVLKPTEFLTIVTSC